MNRHQARTKVVLEATQNCEPLMYGEWFGLYSNCAPFRRFIDSQIQILAEDDFGSVGMHKVVDLRQAQNQLEAEFAAEIAVLRSRYDRALEYVARTVQDSVDGINEEAAARVSL